MFIIIMTIVVTFIILALCMGLLCVRVIFKKDGRFPDTHVDSSPALREKGIFCARTQDWQAAHQKNLFERIEERM